MKQSMKHLMLAAACAAVGSFGAQRAEAAACGGKPQVTVNSSITASVTWFASNEYVLTNVTYVSSGATLTIEPGTVIRGNPPSAPGAGDPGALVISRGSKLVANGTVSSPIVFTDLNDDNVPGCTATAPYNAWQTISANWGGIIVLGETYIGFGAGNTTNGPDPLVSQQVEGVTANGSLGLYGGSDDDDDSGSLSYISIRYGGAGLVANNEINGLTLGAIGRATEIHHIEVINNVDDAFEFFGGTVNCKYMTAFAPGDDGWDTDEGYRGKAQFVSIIQGDAGGASVGSGISDRGFESDGGNPDASQPYSLSTMYNATVVGKGQTGSGGTYTVRETNVGAFIRDNGGQQIYNSLFLDFGGPAVAIANEGGDAAINSRQRWVTAYDNLGFHITTGSGLPAANFYTTQTEGFQADYRDNVVWQCGVTSGMGKVGTSGNWNSIRGDAAAHSGSEPPNPFSENWRAGLIGSSYNNVDAAGNPVTTLTRSGVAAANRMFNVTFLDPRPAVGSPARIETRFAPADGFFTPVGYKGAFAPDGCMWTTGWTAQDALGLLASEACPAAPAADITLLSAVTFSTVDGGVYIINASSDMVNYIPIGMVVGDGNDQTFVDERGLGTRQFYTVTAQ